MFFGKKVLYYYMTTTNKTTKKEIKNDTINNRFNCNNYSSSSISKLWNNNITLTNNKQKRGTVMKQITLSSNQQAIQDIKQAVTGSSGVKDWNQEARNLELARDWEGAAEAYQKAGMYAEAGRVRQMHLENKDPQVKIDIAQLGDKIQDSVVMKDGQSQNDENQI